MDKNEMIRLREEGYTYQQIADLCGVSRQYICQKIGRYTPQYFSPITPKQCKFIGLRNWMNENRIYMRELVRRLYGNALSVNYNRTRARLTSGSSDYIPKSFIDDILRMTGLTYEEAFKEDVVSVKKSNTGN